ncbi:type IV toxin-antitoxin system AbiEi family antitoxin [Jiangella rhizosphaerae]|uniref:AbiEi antitoxin C-terminal domain-containing protein n=1 Tax=Jiangella rhizosphaerae TaxID=2293569 RepID=A0A418KRF7_9ACTN|nr:type IV toxin-antitoxin system AbiEi family antitoxin [Jiangella rhizosphaerae]RIQ23274.1 hypothetical protein DY240_12660 [Jiangella rhizosphaerae]
MYVEREQPVDGEQAVRAVMLALPEEAALYGASAAAWYGLPVEAPADVQIIVPRGTVPRRRPGLEPHEGLGSDDAIVHRGIRVTTPERTWLDLSVRLDDAELVVVGDAMVARGLTTPQRLVERADAARRRRGIVRARSLARLVRDRVDSPQETRLRLILTHHGGLPEPAVNPAVADDHGGWIGRPDLAYEDAKVAIQYEGDVHRTKAKRWRADIARDEVLRDHGWEVVRVTADDLIHRSRLCDRVRRAIDRQRRRTG